jgi:hypothetical protein
MTSTAADAASPPPMPSTEYYANQYLPPQDYYGYQYNQPPPPPYQPTVQTVTVVTPENVQYHTGVAGGVVVVGPQIITPQRKSRQPYLWQYTLSCLAFWLFFVVFGLIAFILIVMAQKKATAGKLGESNKLAQISLIMSVIGIIIGCGIWGFLIWYIAVEVVWSCYYCGPSSNCYYHYSYSYTEDTCDLYHYSSCYYHGTCYYN